MSSYNRETDWKLIGKVIYECSFYNWNYTGATQSVKPSHVYTYVEYNGQNVYEFNELN